jgi:hypothetical protein
MIKYQLICQYGHEFEGWFQSGTAFEEQAAEGDVVCAVCGSGDVSKSIMAPNVTVKRSDGDHRIVHSDAALEAEQMQSEIRMFREKLLASAEYVGPRFADEVRQMHDDEEPRRHVWGEATGDEVNDLLDDGIAVFPVPPLPEELD